MTPGQKAYVEFLESPFWIGLTEQRTRTVGKRCELCHSQLRKLQGHHLIYRKNWLDTSISDIRMLCEPCHLFGHLNFPKYSASEYSSEWAWTQLKLAAKDHVKGCQLTDKKLQKRREAIVKEKKFWVLLTQEQGILVREALKLSSTIHPENMEHLKEIAKLIRVRMKGAELKLKNRQKRWEQCSAKAV